MTSETMLGSRTDLSERAETDSSRANGAAPAVSEQSQSVVYEHPLNERMRTFLRLGFLYSQVLYHNQSPNLPNSRAAVASLLEILAITARGDVRSDVIKEIERQAHILDAFRSKPGVDLGRLKLVMSDLLRLRTELLALNANFMQPLRESEFLNGIKHRSAIPGGTCEFDLPDYNYWLNRPSETRLAMFDCWLDLLRPLCEGVTQTLWVTRQSASPRSEVAPGGVYHVNFERELPIQLLRIKLPADSNFYPEISGSHHRCSLRFMSWPNLDQRPTQAAQDVNFQLTCCG